MTRRRYPSDDRPRTRKRGRYVNVNMLHLWPILDQIAAETSRTVPDIVRSAVAEYAERRK